MSEKRVMTFMFYEDIHYVDKNINSWLDDKEKKSRMDNMIFEVLDIKVSTSYSKEYSHILTVMIIYTEKSK